MMKHKKKAKHAGPSIRKEIRLEESMIANRPPWYQPAAWPIAALLCVVMFFLLIHGSDYSRRKGYLTFDESIYIRLGLQLKNGEPYNTQKIYEEKKRARVLPKYLNRPVFKHPPLYPWLISMAYAALEEKSAYKYEELYGAASKVSNLAGCLLVLLGFMFARRYYGLPAALLAAFLLAIDLNITLSSQKIWIESTLSFFMFWTLYLVYKACEEHKAYFYPAGIIFGFALLTKYTAVLVAPVLISYLLIYHRPYFKQKEIYFFFGLAGLILLPWVIHNLKVYGFEAFKVMVLGQTSGPEKFVHFAAFAAVTLFVFTGAVLARKMIRPKKDTGQDGAEENNMAQTAGVIAVGILIAVLFTQKPFLASIMKSLDWSQLPRAGWDMSLFRGETWYFYLKQQMEYSPVYLFLLVAFLRAPFGQRQDVFLFLACFWILLFTSVWGNFQGRYVLSFVTPAVLLISSTVVLIFRFLLKQKNTAGYIGSGFLLLLMAYFVLKALKVYAAIALNDNVAYF